MRAEMPKRFWKNLPEAELIRPLMADAVQRAREMVANPPTAAFLRKGAEAAAEPAPRVLYEGLAEVRAAAMDCRGCPPLAAGPRKPSSERDPTRRGSCWWANSRATWKTSRAGHSSARQGQLLDRALTEAGIDRPAVYVTNAVKHFKFVPRGKRRIHQKPSSLEIKACNHWIADELALVDPKLIVALGATAARALFGRAVPIGETRGQLLDHGGRKIVVTVHPSYLLRLPDEETRHREYAAFVADLRLAEKAAV